MTRMLDTREFLDTVCELLNQGERNVAIPVAGGSMIPFLHHGDMVYLNLPEGKLKRGDVVLYTRSSGRYILHRIYRVNKDGSFIMVGDAQQDLEQLPSRDQIRAQAVSVRHKGKINRPGEPRWWFYQHVWLWLRPFRHSLMSLREKLRSKRKS